MSLQEQAAEQTKTFQDIIDWIAKCQSIMQRVLDQLPPDVVNQAEIHVGTRFQHDAYFSDFRMFDRIAENIYPDDCLPRRLHPSMSAIWPNRSLGEDLRLQNRQEALRRRICLCVCRSNLTIDNWDHIKEYIICDTLDVAAVAEELKTLLRRHSWMQ